jgi:uncharacterized protein YndB with AHSA1/START domain
MNINRNAPATAAGEVLIEADPQVVWDLMADVAGWPTWRPDIKSLALEGPVAPGTRFRWRSGASSITSTLQVVEPPRELAWTGSTIGIKAVHVFRFEPKDGGTLARSEESWEGPLASLLKGYSRKTLDKEIRGWLAVLKAEAERRAST